MFCFFLVFFFLLPLSDMGCVDFTNFENFDSGSTTLGGPIATAPISIIQSCIGEGPVVSTSKNIHRGFDLDALAMSLSGMK